MIGVSVKADLKAIERADKRLAKYMGRDLAYRARKVYFEAAKLGVPHIRGAAPRGRTGNLARSTLARPVKLRGGIEIAAASVGPRGGKRKGSHKYPVIHGHRIVTRTGRDTGQRAAPIPYVDRVASDWVPRAEDFVRKRVLDIGYGASSIAGRFGSF